MSALGRLVQSWPMLGSLGAGLVLTALAAGAELLPGAVLAGCGIAALGWGVLALRAGRILAPRATLGAGVILLVASAAIAATGSSTSIDVPLLPLLAADLLVGIVALGAAGVLRSRRVPTTEPATSGRTRTATRATGAVHVVGLLAGSALVAALATPALAATEAGSVAVPHGELHAPQHETH